MKQPTLTIPLFLLGRTFYDRPFNGEFDLTTKHAKVTKVSNRITFTFVFFVTLVVKYSNFVAVQRASS